MATHELAVNELRDHGYPYAKVETARGAGDKEVDADVHRGAGHAGAFRTDRDLRQPDASSDRVIERQLTFKPGDLYRRSVVQDSQRRLYAMELFLFVNIEPLEPEKQEPDGQDAGDGGGGQASARELRRRLRLGRESARRHRVPAREFPRAAPGRPACTDAIPILDRGIRFEFNQPYLLTPQFSMGAEAQHWNTFTPAYQSTITGGKATLTHRPNRFTSWSASFMNERNNSKIAESVRDDLELRSDLIALGLDPETGKQDGTLNAFGFDFQRSTADNLLNARRGYQLAVHAELAPAIHARPVSTSTPSPRTPATTCRFGERLVDRQSCAARQHRRAER